MPTINATLSWNLRAFPKNCRIHLFTSETGLRERCLIWGHLLMPSVRKNPVTSANKTPSRSSQATERLSKSWTMENSLWSTCSRVHLARLEPKPKFWKELRKLKETLRTGTSSKDSWLCTSLKLLFPNSKTANKWNISGQCKVSARMSLSMLQDTRRLGVTSMIWLRPSKVADEMPKTSNREQLIYR